MDARNRLWIGTEGGGLNQFNAATATFTSYQHTPQQGQQLTHNDVVTLAEDRQHNLWIGTRNGGINVLHPGQFIRLLYL